jgi:hypothetical protein
LVEALDLAQAYALLGTAFGYLGYGPQVDERRFDSHDARWETITTNKETFGHAPFRLRAIESSAAVELASNEIYAHLQMKPNTTVRLQLCVDVFLELRL